MVPPAIISGALLLVLMKVPMTVVQHAPLSLGALLELKMVTPCGMDRGVVPLAPVARSTRHHGSMFNCLLSQLITLRSGLEEWNGYTPCEVFLKSKTS